jgi:hypothetical protein
MHFMTNVGYQVKIRNTDEKPKEFTFIGAKEEKLNTWDILNHRYGNR